MRVSFPERFYVELLDYAKDVERDHQAVVTFPSRREAVIKGSDVAVAMASSSIDQKISDLSAGKVPRRESPALNGHGRSDIDPSLKEFAIKLGYTEQEIGQVVRKLGADVDQNTLLHELIKISSHMQSFAPPRPKAEETRRSASPAMLPPRRDRFSHEVVARGASSSATPLPTLSDFQVNSRGPSFCSSEDRVHAARGSNTASSMRPVAHERTVVPNDHGFQEEQMIYQLIGVTDKGGNRTSNLRPIVVDGSNVAMR